MSRPPALDLNAILALMAKPNNRLMTMAEIAAPFCMPPESMRYHVGKLIAAGDVLMAKPARSQSPAQYSLTRLPAAYVGSPAPAFRVNRYTPPLTGYAARLNAAASLAMASRA